MNENMTIKDLLLPIKVLISPIKTFSQLAQKPSAIGLLSLSALILVVIAAAQYASATKIYLEINGQQMPTSFLATDAFGGWFANTLVSTALGILFYWLIFASGLALISKMLRGKEISWRVLFSVLAYVLSVFIILYIVRAVVYLALPSIPFETSSWPPVNQTDMDSAINLMTERWGPLYAYQFGTYFTLVAFVWLVMLGAIAVRALREVTWGKAGAVSVIGFSITLFVFGLP